MSDPVMLSVETMELLTAGRCPDCGAGGKESALRVGPAGGMSRNTACHHCGSEFNVARMDGHVVMAHRNSVPGAPDRDRLRTVLGIVLR
jgi:hypothetical protein